MGELWIFRATIAIGSGVLVWSSIYSLNDIGITSVRPLPESAAVVVALLLAGIFCFRFTWPVAFSFVGGLAGFCVGLFWAAVTFVVDLLRPEPSIFERAEPLSTLPPTSVGLLIGVVVGLVAWFMILSTVSRRN